MSLRLASAEVFENAKRLLAEVGFDEPGLADLGESGDAKSLLAGLFLQARAAPLAAVRETLSEPGRAALFELGLLRLDGEECRASALLYPLHGIHVVSDFPGTESSDFVFPAISVQTHEYLGILPPTPCDALLEVGTGSGAAALLCAHYAGAVWAGDVSERCLLFAEFNRRLNGIENVEIRRSDVYDGFPELTFDRIVAHPPYVPWSGRQEAYRHGGPDGEAVLRRLLEGLADKLRPGGRLYCATMGCDTADAPLEQRLRRMLGPRGAAFDLLIAERELLAPMEFLVPWMEGEDLGVEDACSLAEEFKKRKIRRLVRCSLVVARRAELREPLTLRRRAGDSTGAADLDAALDVPPAPPPAWDELLPRRLALADDARMETVELRGEGRWRPVSRVLVVERPFAFRTDCPDWAAELLDRLDGRRTLGEALAGIAIEDVEEAEIFLGCLWSAGALEAAGVASLNGSESDIRPTPAAPAPERGNR